jgi:hypothetical protein
LNRQWLRLILVAAMTASVLAALSSAAEGASPTPSSPFDYDIWLYHSGPSKPWLVQFLCEEDHEGSTAYSCGPPGSLTAKVIRSGKTFVSKTEGPLEGSSNYNQTYFEEYVPEPGDVLQLILEGSKRAEFTYEGFPSLDPGLDCHSETVTGGAGPFTEGYLSQNYSTPLSISNGGFTASTAASGYGLGSSPSIVLRNESALSNDENLEVSVENSFEVACPSSSPSIVEPPEPAENHAPTAHKDAGESTGSPASGNVLSNDTDPDGDPLTLTGYTQGALGKVECSPSGDCTYTPGPKYTDHDSFSYTISDGRGGTSSARDFIRAHPLPVEGPIVLKQKLEPCGQFDGFVGTANSTDNHPFVYTWKLGALFGETPLVNDFRLFSDVQTIRCNSADIVNISYGWDPRSLFATDGYDGLEWASVVEYQFRYAGTNKWIACPGKECFRKLKIANTEKKTFGMPGNSAKYSCPSCTIPAPGKAHLVFSASKSQPIKEVRYMLLTGTQGGFSKVNCRVAVLGQNFKNEPSSECNDKNVVGLHTVG